MVDAPPRPRPPEFLGEAFAPAPDITEWAAATILDEAGSLHNPDHLHLQQARIGALWSSATARVGGAVICGQAEIPSLRGKGFIKPRQEFQLREWFCESPWDPLPDFIITISAGFAESCNDATWCALVEHELYHCGQAVDEFGAPRFHRDTGRPIFTTRVHDVEEFVGVVERYGPGAAAGRTADLVKAASKAPIVANAKIQGACGTCLRKVA